MYFIIIIILFLYFSSPVCSAPHIFSHILVAKDTTSYDITVLWSCNIASQDIYLNFNE